MKSTPQRRNSRPGAKLEAVAERAGVSKAAVSRVLNQGYASPAMKKKVETAMKALNYSPSVAARNFASGRTGVIGLVVNNLEGAWVSPLLLGIEQSINQDRKASLLLASLTHQGTHDLSVVRSWLKERRVDGLIFVRPRRSESSLVDDARSAGVPFALIAPDISARGGLEFRSDNALGGELVAEHLLALGHLRFAFIGGEKTSRDSRERFLGLERILVSQGLGVPLRDQVTGSFAGEDGKAFAKRWLKRKPSTRPTAIVFADDTMALGFIGEVLKAGVKIPQEVSVTGFNNLPGTELLWPTLTTVEQPLTELGRLACAKLMQQISLSPTPEEVKKSIFPVRLISRGTSGPAP